MAVSFVLRNPEFPPLPTVPKLTSINAFSDKYISNATIVTPFLKTVLPISKNFVPEDKPVCRLLRTTCKSEFVPIKRHTVNHVSCKSFLSRDPISVVSPVDVVNVNVKFTPLRSCVHVVKSLFRSLCVFVLKTPSIFTVNTVLPPNACNVVSRIIPAHRLCRAPQYTHTAVVNNPTNTSYLRHERISCFLQPGTNLTCPSLTSSSSSLLSNKLYSPIRSTLSNRICRNSEQDSCSAKFSLFSIFLM